MEKQELIELINTWKNGNEEAYNIIYKEYHDRMLKIALAHTQVSGHSNMADAEDVVQDAMLKAYTNIQSLDDPAKFEGWLTRIVVNKANDYMTSALKKKNVLETDYTLTNDEGKESQFDAEDSKRERQPEIKLDTEVKQNIVQEILQNLSEDQRAVTIMYFYDEMTMKEIASQLGIQMSTVIGRLQTAKKAIKAEVTAIQQRDDIKLYNLSAIPAIPFFMAMLGTAKETVSDSGTSAIVTNVVENTVEKAAPSSNTDHSKQFESNSSELNNTDTNVQKVNPSSENGNLAETAGEVSKTAEPLTASSATAGSAIGTGTVASVTAGSSVVTKIIVGIAVAAAATGGGIALKNNLTANNNQPVTSVVEEPAAKEETEEKEDQKADEEQKEEQVAKPKVVDQEPQVTDESNIISVDIPDGWTAQNETISSKWTSLYNGEAPVYAIYSGDAGDKTKPFVMISSMDATGLGGAYDLDGPPNELTFYDSYTSSSGLIVNSVSGPLNLMDLQYLFAKGYSGIPEDTKCYEFSFSSQNDSSRGHFQLIYFPMGDDSKLDDVKSMVNSLSLNILGSLTVNVDEMNVRFAPSVSALVGQPTNNYEHFNVYQIAEAEGYTWYRIGSYSWIADNGQGWVTYKENN